MNWKKAKKVVTAVALYGSLAAIPITLGVKACNSYKLDQHIEHSQRAYEESRSGAGERFNFAQNHQWELAFMNKFRPTLWGYTIGAIRADAHYVHVDVDNDGKFDLGTLADFVVKTNNPLTLDTSLTRTPNTHMHIKQGYEKYVPEALRYDLIVEEDVSPARLNLMKYYQPYDQLAK